MELDAPEAGSFVELIAFFEAAVCTPSAALSNPGAELDFTMEKLCPLFRLLVPGKRTNCD